MSRVFHGGQLDDAIARHGGDFYKWIDLSTGINSVGWPVSNIDEKSWSRLPDFAAEMACREAAARYYGAGEQAFISLAPGSQMHIQQLPFLYKPQPVAVVGFSYQEHGVCWQRAGHDVYVSDGLESAEATARIIIVVNPNNPDGRTIDPQDLIALSRRLAAKGGLLIVDEAFADTQKNISVASEAGRDGLLVLRSIGKFFGLAGIRLGVAITTQTLATRLDERLGPWAVSGPALQIATNAFDDIKWQRKSQKRLETMRKDLERVLLESQMEIVGGTHLFVLAQLNSAVSLAEHLAQNQILVRTFPGKPNWIRFGLPAKKAELNRLQKALAAFAPSQT